MRSETDWEKLADAVSAGLDQVDALPPEQQEAALMEAMGRLHGVELLALAGIFKRRAALALERAKLAQTEYARRQRKSARQMIFAATAAFTRSVPRRGVAALVQAWRQDEG